MLVLAGLLWLAAADPLAEAFTRAAQALAAGDYAAAEAGFQKVLQSAPRNIGALGNLGVVYSRMGRVDKAIAMYQRALTLAPADKGLLLNLSLAYLKQELYPDARRLLTQLVKAEPGHLQARELLATCELHLGQTESALRSLEALAQEDKANPGLLYLLGIGYLKQKKPVEASRAFDAFLAATPPALANFTLCKAHYESERFEEAAEFCRKALAADAATPGARRELGKALISLRHPDAVAELERAVMENPQDAEALYFLGAELLQEDRAPEGVAQLERARQLNPGFWGTYFYLGKAKAQAGAHAAALPLLQRAAELNGSEPAIFYQLGRSLAAVGRAAEAKRALDRVRQLKAEGLEREARVLGGK